jgi:diketogulonate reductase-like aldo/keto reductase
MAYSPIEQGRILKNRTLLAVAQRHAATAAQVALAFVLRRDGIIAIPRAGDLAHVRENRGALAVRLDADDLAAIDRAFAPPRRKVPLEML